MNMQASQELDVDCHAFYELRDSTDSFLRERRTADQTSQRSASSGKAAPAAKCPCVSAPAPHKQAAHAAALHSEHLHQLQGNGEGGHTGSEAAGNTSDDATIGFQLEETLPHADSQLASAAGKKEALAAKQASSSASSCLITTSVQKPSCSHDAPLRENSSAASSVCNKVECTTSGEKPECAEPAALPPAAEAAQCNRFQGLLSQLHKLAAPHVAKKPDSVSIDVGVERYLGMAQAECGNNSANLTAQALRLAVEDRLLSRMCVL